MAAIRSSGNQDTELKLVALFKIHGIMGWRRKQRVFGKPDFIFRRQKVAVFVDGCFWHGCRWHCRMPKSRRNYWEPKIVRNKKRDGEVSRLLQRRGWIVFRIWEHTLKHPGGALDRLQAVLAFSSQKR
jgi:DNA mismatch endonuclease (patch repair protein)